MTERATFKLLRQERFAMMIKSAGTPHHGLTTLALIVLMLFLASLFAAKTLQARDAAPHLSSNTDVATAGFYQLSWETDAGNIELQEATQSSFHNPVTYYKGADRATVISGRPNGTWYYRIRAIGAGQPGPWSEPVKVTVAHHSLSRALMFLSLGIIVFVAIVVMIVRGPEKAG